MDPVSFVMPSVPAMAPVLFDVPEVQAPSLPLNFWTLLLAPVPEPEPAEAAMVPVTEGKVASPQQIAQAVIRSMLSPVAIHEDRAPDRRKDEEPPPTPIEPTTPLAVAAQPQISLPITIPDPANPEPRPKIAPDQRALGLPEIVSATTKTVPKDPVAFELRLMPASNPDSDKKPATASIQNAIAPIPVRPHERRKDEPTIPTAPPIPKAAPVVGEVPVTPSAHEPRVANAPAPSLPEALTAPALIETPRAEPSSAPVQEIAMRVSAPDSQPVDVRVSERRGEIHVAVHTPDTGLKSSLQGDLGSLIGKLEDAGFRTEARVPEISAHPLTTHSTADLSGSGTYGEAPDTRGESNGRWTGSDSRQPSDRQQQQQQQHRRAARTWEEMMEDMQ